MRYVWDVNQQKDSFWFNQMTELIFVLRLPDKIYSVRREISRPLWNQKVHYPVYKIPILVPTWSQLNSDLTLTNQLIKILFNIISQSEPGLCKWDLPSGFSTEIVNEFLISSMTSYFYPPWSDKPNSTFWKALIMMVIAESYIHDSSILWYY